MIRTADISRDGLYRWTLRRRWAEGPDAREVCWVMLNPSTADAEKDDPTIRSIIKRSEAWGYGALVVVNLYPFRSSSPTECMDWDAGQSYHGEAHVTNRRHLYEETQAAGLVVAAWGAHTWINKDVISASLPPRLWCIGKTMHGAPKHPLARVPEDTPPQLWSPLGGPA